MLYCHNSRHSITDILPGEIHILILKYAKLPCILVDNYGKLSLKAGKMCSALLSVNIVTETKDILLKRVHELYRTLYLNALACMLEVDDIVKCLKPLIERLYISLNSIRLMEYFALLLISSLIFKIYGKSRIKICCLM